MAVDELKELLKNAKGYTSTHDSDNWEVQEFFDEFNKSEDLIICRQFYNKRRSRAIMLCFLRIRKNLS